MALKEKFSIVRGKRVINLTQEEVTDCLIYNLDLMAQGALKERCRLSGRSLSYQDNLMLREKITNGLLGMITAKMEQIAKT